MDAEVGALIALHAWLNHPLKSGRLYTTYDKQAVKAGLNTLSQLIEAKGVTRDKGAIKFEQ